MPLQLVTPPTAEPLSLAEAKRHLRVTTTDEDGLVAALIAAARDACETRIQRQVMAARWKQVMDSFPGPSLMGVPYGRPYGLPPQAILLERASVLQVVSVQYVDMGGATQTLTAGTDYVVDLASEPARITPPFGKIWPIPLPQIAAVTVTFDAGCAALLTANAGADTISVPGWKTLAVNDTLRVSNRDKTASADGALPAPLADHTDYYVKTVSGTNLYQLAATAGGTLIDLTNAGTGESFIGEIPAALRAWMLLAIGTLYENRETVSVDSRISVAELPSDFRDSLLDPWRMVLA